MYEITIFDAMGVVAREECTYPTAYGLVCWTPAPVKGPAEVWQLGDLTAYIFPLS